MKKLSSWVGVVAVSAMLAGGLVQTVASAQTSKDKASKHRQKTKNDWRNGTIGSGAVGLYGLIKGDKALAAAGLAGSAYSASRYEHDRKSQSKIDRARAAKNGTWVTRNGKRYKRVISRQNGKRVVRYVRA